MSNKEERLMRYLSETNSITSIEAIEQLGVNPEEVKGLGDDEFVSMEEYMKNAYNALNPFGL